MNEVRRCEELEKSFGESVPPQLRVPSRFGKVKSVPDLEKYGKRKAEYGTICALADFAPI